MQQCALSKLNCYYIHNFVCIVLHITPTYAHQVYIVPTVVTSVHKHNLHNNYIIVLHYHDNQRFIGQQLNTEWQIFISV